ncbi:uncharacterized protein [Misgurnus anguillicaudatus]|uniref:uncharacterized protein n=1 Tax=Misgurnus anguillicaudatus TaxID=75329 RepID=UPI003CCF0D4A
MATSKDDNREPDVRNRPSRVRQPPGYLADYELGHSAKQLLPSKGSLHQANERCDHTQPDLNTPDQNLHKLREEERWQRLEARYKDMSKRLEELQITMDSTKRMPYPQSCPAYPSHYHQHPQHYSSLPQLELGSPIHSPLGHTTSGVTSRQTVATDYAVPVQHTPLPSPHLGQDTAMHQRSVPQSALHQASPAQPVMHQAHPPSPRQSPLQYQSYCPYPPYPAGLYYPQHVPPPPGQPLPMQPAVHYAPSMPLADPTVLGILEMAIASSFGIPKPKLTPFSSGKESDFIMMKKGLDSVLGPHKHLSEDYKYQVLLELLKLPNAYQVAKRYVNDPTPYTSAIHALEQRYGQPRQLVQGELKAILNSPPIKPGDAQAFEDFSAAVSTLVGLLGTMDGPSRAELRCGSHVDTLLSKLPANYRDGFAEYCISQGIIRSGTDNTYTLPDFALWLERKAQAIQVSRRVTEASRMEHAQIERRDRATRPQKSKSANVYITNRQVTSEPPHSPDTPSAYHKPGQSSTKKRERFKPYCPYCSNQEHYLSACTEFAKLNTTEKANWIKEKNKCWRCGRGHKPETCTLKKPCSTCNDQHLIVLHEVALQANQSVLTVSTTSSMVYVGQASHSSRVLLKVVPVQLHNGGRTLDTHAVLDDGSERTIILPAAAKHLGLYKEDEVLPLRTIRQDVVKLKGASVSFEVSSQTNKQVKYQIHHAFTADELSLADQSCPVESLKKRYDHLRGVLIRGFNRVQPMLLIGSDHPHLITPVCPVQMGPQGGPVAISTLLGWAIQGPINFLQNPTREASCLHTAFLPSAQDLHQHVERLWQIDTLPYRSEKEAVRSKQDQVAISTLEKQTIRVTVDGVARYATPLLRKAASPRLHAPPAAVMPLLRATERRLVGRPDLAKVYKEEINKLVKAGYVVKISSDEASQSNESWYIPHHIVHHNGKARVVFNCSFKYQQHALNDTLLPGPNLGSTLLGVLLRFREYPVAISGDIRGMFHQIRLLREDQPLLRFLWRDMERDRNPDIYEWRVLPFGTTCSPCCAIYALQRHAKDNSSGNQEVLDSVINAFYVDNCLQSLRTPSQAKQLIDKMRALLADGGFDMRQWASNQPEVIAHLPPEARSEGYELWLTADRADPQESTLGLRWHCPSDTIGYKHRQAVATEPTLRNVYRVLASQYDPLGYIIPYTTRAKVLIQALWRNEQGWDEPITGELLSVWQSWENELSHLHNINMPRCYMPVGFDLYNSPVDLHIFCDASEKAYGSVAYLRAEGDEGHIHVSFVMSRSRVAPRRQLSMPRLELSAALTGAQLAKLLHTELTIPFRQTTMWSDSTTVLSWIQSDSSQYKVFVGTRIGEIQELTDATSWRYVSSEHNPADDITRGKSLYQLTQPTRWKNGPAFLYDHPAQWPAIHTVKSEDVGELKKFTFCGQLTVPDASTPDPSQYNTWSDLLQATYQSLHGAAALPMSASDRLDTEVVLLRRAQSESFPEEINTLQHSHPIRPTSRLSPLSPEYDQTLGLIRVGGRLRKAEDLPEDSVHPIVLAPDHPITQLLVRDYDDRLLHAGPERIFAEIRRTYWILRGRQVIKKHQRQCVECCKWRSKLVIPKMADLPAA